jgi:hypothetical protein
MGQEVECTAVWNGDTSVGRAYLESDHILFRGSFRVKIAVSEIREIRSIDGTLIVSTADGDLTLAIGHRADRWLAAIRSPKPLLDKLEVRPGRRIALEGPIDPAFVEELTTRAGAPDAPLGTGPYHAIFFGVDAPGELAALENLRAKLAPGGMIWVVMRKGKEATVRDADLFAAAAAAGLTAVKVASFSATHTAQKLVVRKSA